MEPAVLRVTWKPPLSFQCCIWADDCITNILIFHMKCTVPPPVTEQTAAEGRCPWRVGMSPICSPFWQRQSHSERLLLISKDSFLSLADSSSNWLWAKQRQQFFLPSGYASWSRWCPFSLSVPHLPNRGRKMPLGWQDHFYTDSLNIPAALSFQDNSIGVNLVLSSPHVDVCKTTNDFMVLTRIPISCFKYLLVLLFSKELPSAYDSSLMIPMTSLKSWSLLMTSSTLQIQKIHYAPNPKRSFVIIQEV